MYLFDTFKSVPNNQGDSNTSISGFIVPEMISGETGMDDVAKFTMFVGEGDEQLSQNDFVGFKGESSPEKILWDGITVINNASANPHNVLNSKSLGLSAPGIDLDTFHIKWSDNLLFKGDTSANINIHTENDGYVVIYLILSFRSTSTTGGTLSYLIKN